MGTFIPPLVYPLGQANIPLILPSSGSIAANGALTLTTALPITFANCWMYFPAGAVFSGSAAGLWFVQMSSATVGTIFNNILGTGTPTIPASPTAIVATGPGAYTQTTAADLTTYQLTIPANTMQATDQLRISATYTTPNNANNKIPKMKFGATAIRSLTITAAVTWVDSFRLVNKNAQNVQSLSINSNGNGTVAGASTSVLAANSAIDFTQAQTLAVTLNMATATDFMIFDECLVERIAGVP